MFSYEVITAEEAMQSMYNLLPDGIYNFEVKKAEYKQSSKGNPMIALTLAIFGNDGVVHLVFDYLVSIPSMYWKTRTFCESVGLLKEYENKTFNENLCEGRCGRVRIFTQKGKKKEDGSSYPDKNAVNEYIFIENTANNEKKKAEQKNEAPVFDDDIPF